MRCACFGLCAALLFVCGCTTIELEYQSLPAPEALESIQAGITSRSEVLERLGPPEEMRRPAPFERQRPSSPQFRRTIEAGEIFGDGAYTYARERHTIRTFGLLPTGPGLFQISWRKSREDRWRLEFDESGVVRTVFHIDEIADDHR
jgi:hypothetical protein